MLLSHYDHNEANAACKLSENIQKLAGGPDRSKVWRDWRTEALESLSRSEGKNVNVMHRLW